MTNDSLQDRAEIYAATLERGNFKELNNIYGDVHSAYESIRDLKFTVAEVTKTHEDKLNAKKEKNKAFDRMTLYYGDIKDSNKSWESMFKTFYYILIVILVVIIVLKQDSSPNNYPIIAGLILVPILLTVIIKLIY